MAAGPDYIVDVDGVTAPQRPANANSLRGRPWLAVHWRCCSVYSRVYRNRRGDAYIGHCPRCGKKIRARVGNGGIECRFFEAH